MKNYLVPAMILILTGIQPAGAADASAPVTVALKTAEGAEAGTATLTQTKEGVLLFLDLKNLSAGEHAFHIHEKGECAAPDFKSAGGHLNPGGHPHGYGNAEGSHEGDMPNIFVSSEGTTKVHVLNTHVTLEPGDDAKHALLTDEDGAAIIVHAGPDDYATQPSGNAGDRVACGVIR